jgi:uncharacterized protein
MAGSPRTLRLNTVELLRQPGTRRPVETEVAPVELGVSDPRVGHAEVTVELVAESTLDGIVVRATSPCRGPTSAAGASESSTDASTIDVDELYQHEVSDPDAFEIGPDALDLTSLVRDGILLALVGPPPLCADDCAGICPVCGADRNEGECGCDTAVRDDRWAALDQLRPDE